MTKVENLFVRSAHDETDFDILKTNGTGFVFVGQVSFDCVGDFQRNPATGMLQQALPMSMIPPEVRDTIPQHSTCEAHRCNTETWGFTRLATLPMKVVHKYPGVMDELQPKVIYLGVIDRVSSSFQYLHAFKFDGRTVSPNHEHYTNSSRPLLYSALVEIRANKEGVFDTMDTERMRFIRIDCDMENEVDIPINDKSIMSLHSTSDQGICATPKVFVSERKRQSSRAKTSSRQIQHLVTQCMMQLES